MAIKYKLQESEGNHFTIIKLSSDPNFTGWSIPRDINNSMYDEFIQDVKEQGLDIVEGTTVVGIVTYTEARASEYPSLQEQQDMQYWDAVNGTTTWKDKITSIKTKYPKSQVGVTSIAPLPDWVVGLTTS